MLITGTPLAWVVRLVLASCLPRPRPGLSGGMGLALLLLSAEPLIEDRQGRTFAAALQRTKAILVEPQTMGIIALGAVTYASSISLRGLWLVPLLTDRHGLTLIKSGHVALAGSIVVLFGPPLFGRVDPGDRKRRRLIVGCTIVYAGLFALLASGTSATGDVVIDRDSEWAGWLLRAPIRGRTVIFCTGCVGARNGDLQYVDVSRRGRDAMDKQARLLLPQANVGSTRYAPRGGSSPYCY